MEDLILITVPYYCLTYTYFSADNIADAMIYLYL